MLLLDSVSRLSSSASVNCTYWVLGELVAAHSILALYRHVTRWAIVAVLNARAALIVQQMKGDTLVLGGSVWMDTSPKDSNPVRNGGIVLNYLPSVGTRETRQTTCRY